MVIFSIFKNPLTNQYEYLHADLRPWDPLNDLYQYEHDFIVSTKTKHKTPMIRTQSIINVQDGSVDPGVVAPTELSPIVVKVSSRRRKSTRDVLGVASADSKFAGHNNLDQSDSGDGGVGRDRRSGGHDAMTSSSGISMSETLRILDERSSQTNERLARIQHQLELMNYNQKDRDSRSNINRDMVLLVVLVVMIQALLNWYLTHKIHHGQFDGSTGGGGGH